MRRGLLVAMVLMGAGCEKKYRYDLCEGSTPILDDDGTPTGIERCDDGSMHRVSDETHDNTIVGESCRGNEAYEYECKTDADCTSGVNPRCLHVDHLDLGGRRKRADTGASTGDDGCVCASSCVNDADCETGKACIPASIVDKDDVSWATCEPATCRTDAECALGECGVVPLDWCGYHGVDLDCRTVEDECRILRDCDGDGDCVSVPNGYYECRQDDCVF